MNAIHYEIFCRTTATTVIYSKSNILRNYTCQQFSYCQALLFNCYVLQGQITGISQMLIVLILIKMYPLFINLLIYQWNVLRSKSKIIQLLIQLF